MVKDAFSPASDTLKVVFMNSGFEDEDVFLAGLVYFKLVTRLNQRGKLPTSTVLGSDTRVTSNQDESLTQLSDLWYDVTNSAETGDKTPNGHGESMVNGISKALTLKVHNGHGQNDKLPILQMCSVEFIQQELAKELIDRQTRFRKLFNKVKAGTLKQDTNNKKLGHLRKTEVKFLTEAKDRLESRFARLRKSAADSIRRLT